MYAHMFPADKPSVTLIDLPNLPVFIACPRVNNFMPVLDPEIRLTGCIVPTLGLLVGGVRL